MMKKLIIYPVVAIITIIVIIFLYLTIIFDLNDYKEDITKYASNKINNYNVTYDGRIEADYFPNTIISVPNINIYSPKTKKSLIKMKCI